jgi:hypothetical protein
MPNLYEIAAGVVLAPGERAELESVLDQVAAAETALDVAIQAEYLATETLREAMDAHSAAIRWQRGKAGDFEVANNQLLGLLREYQLTRTADGIMHATDAVYPGQGQYHLMAEPDYPCTREACGHPRGLHYAGGAPGYETGCDAARGCECVGFALWAPSPAAAPPCASAASLTRW